MSKTALMEQHSHVLGLKDINISMPGGCIQVIMGLSGSGKSTLIRHINRLIDPTVGEVLVDGVDVVKMNKSLFAAVPPPPNRDGFPEVRASPASDGARQRGLRP
jgi:ABC-type proline/glycine betaine transport system ATPase subunit